MGFWQMPLISAVDEGTDFNLISSFWLPFTHLWVCVATENGVKTRNTGRCHRCTEKTSFSSSIIHSLLTLRERREKKKEFLKCNYTPEIAVDKCFIHGDGLQLFFKGCLLSECHQWPEKDDQIRFLINLCRCQASVLNEGFIVQKISLCGPCAAETLELIQSSSVS